MDGDAVSNRGAISGGYQDAGRSRLINMKMLREDERIRSELRKESVAVKDKLQAAEQAVTAVLGDIQHGFAACRHRQQGVDRLKTTSRIVVYDDQSRGIAGAKNEDVSAIR